MTLSRSDSKVKVTSKSSRSHEDMIHITRWCIHSKTPQGSIKHTQNTIYWLFG